MSAALLGTSIDLLGMFTPEWAATGTGLQNVSSKSFDTFGDNLFDLIPIIKTQLPALFGDYPTSGDTAPSAVFIAVFALLFFVHLAQFGLNWAKGHKFYVTLGLAVHALWKCIGFGIRIKWIDNMLDVPVAIASVVFTQVPPLILCVINMYLASRVFAWRHPEAGRSTWFRANNTVIYCLVVGVIVMAILGTALPNIYFMTPKHYRMCQKVAEAAAVLQLVYAVAGLIMLGAAYSFKPGKIDQKFVFGNKNKTPEEYPQVLQATWVEKYSPFYTPAKGSGRVVYKDEPVYRIMPGADPANGLVRNVSEGPQGPKIGTANLIIALVSLGLLVMSCFRCASMFIHKQTGGRDKPFVNVVFTSTIFYVFYGAVEALISIFMLVARIDLRFYLPEVQKRHGEAPTAAAAATSEHEKGTHSQSDSNSNV